MSRMRVLAALMIGILGVLLISVLLLLRHAQEQERALRPGRRFPPLEIELIPAGTSPDRPTRMRLPSGRKTLVVFIRTDCLHCERELQRLDRACAQVPAEALQCVALSLNPEHQTSAWAQTQAFGRLHVAVSRDPEFFDRHREWFMAVPLALLVTEEGMIFDRRAGERSEEAAITWIRAFVR